MFLSISVIILINYTRRQELEPSDTESIWIEIKLKNSKPFLVCSVYRHPLPNSEWLDNFALQIEKSFLLQNEIYIIIMGDLSINYQNGNFSNKAEFLKKLSLYRKNKFGHVLGCGAGFFGESGSVN